MLELDFLFWFGKIHLICVGEYQCLEGAVLPFGLIQLLLNCVDEVGHDIEDCGVASYVGSSEQQRTVRSFQVLVMACLFSLANIS